MPHPLPARRPLAPVAVRLLLLAAAALLVSSAPATAVANKVYFSAMVVGLPAGAGYVYVAPEEAKARVCLSHDPTTWYDLGYDGEGYYAAWVPLGPDPSAGSEKATTACVFDAPPNLPAPLPELDDVPVPVLLDCELAACPPPL